MTVSRRVNELEEKYKRLEEAFRSELEAEINSSYGSSAGHEHNPNHNIQISRLECCDGDCVDDYFFEIKREKERIGFIFPFRTQAFINATAASHYEYGALEVVLRKRGYLTHLRKSSQSPEDITSDFKRYSGNE